MNLSFVVLALACSPLPAATAGSARAPAASEPVPEDPALVERCRARLASPDSAQIANAAFEAGEAQLASVVPALSQALTRVLALPLSKEQPFVLRSLVDALIRIHGLDARVPPHELAALATSHALFTEALILASRAPAENASFFESAYDTTRSTNWIAVANLLALAAPAKAVERLLPIARIDVTVFVLDPGASHGSGGGSGSGIGCGTLEAPEGFPPTVLYELEPVSELALDLCAPGPRPIAFVREVHTERRFGIGQSLPPLVRDEYALDLLRWIAGDRVTRSTLKRRVEIDHVWKDRERYLAELRGPIERQYSAWRELVDRLAARELLQPDSRKSAVPIHVRIEDQRSFPRVTLPELPLPR